jgi:KipI family sensor histidine kinase inhibitor
MSWKWVGDRALLVEIGDDDLAAANARIRRLSLDVRDRGFSEVEDLVPAARTLLVLLRPGAEPGSELASLLEAAPPKAEPAPGRLHEIVVRYGGKAGPDLADVAELHELSEESVIALHTSVVYTVGFLGFAPGFPYLIGLPSNLATPRLPTPRTKVPAGSVAIGGEFTGIYPRSTPGGWRLIGGCDMNLFDVERDSPALLAPGDQVKFIRS